MLWSNILYPGNAKCHAEIIGKIQQLKDQMSENFHATNKLSRYLNKEQMWTFWNSSWYKWIVEAECWHPHSTSTQDSAIWKQIDEKLKGELEPDLYKIITDVDTSFEDRIRIAQKMMHVIAGITGATVASVVGKLVAKELADRIASRTASITASSIAGAIAGGIAVDTIAGPIARAIAGVYERSDLESALKS